MASTSRPTPFPAEHKAFLAEFERLLAQYPGTADRFVLADLGCEEPAAAKDIPVVAYECRRTEWGVVCRRDPRPQ